MYYKLEVSIESVNYYDLNTEHKYTWMKNLHSRILDTREFTIRVDVF